MSRRPIFRGLLVREALLCDQIPAPTADLVALAGEVEDRTLDQRCANCHRALDPIGVIFEALDDDVDTEPPPAEVIGNPEIAGTYPDLPALLTAIAASRDFAECFATHWLSFFLEVPQHDVDLAWVAELADSIEAGSGLSTVIEETVAGLSSRAETQIPWCLGE
jgi:hypothetical protein